MRILIFVCFLTLSGLTCPVAAQTVITSGSMNYTVGLVNVNTWTKTLRWSFSDGISYSTSVSSAPQITAEPFLARGGSNIDPFVVDFTAPDGQRGTIVDGGTSIQNCLFGNINNPMTTTLSISVAAHGVPKFRQNTTGTNVIVPFTMYGRISLFINYSPTENALNTRQVIGTGMANIRYNRVDNTHQVQAFDAMPNPKVILSSILFTFAPATRTAPAKSSRRSTSVLALPPR